MSGFTVQGSLINTKNRTNKMTTKNFYKKRLAVSSLGVFFVVSLFLFTNPNTISISYILLLPVVILFLTIYSVQMLLSLLTSIEITRVKRISIIIAFAPTLMIMLNSLGQLSLQDIVLVVLFVSGFAWYFKRVQITRSYQ
jgi:hypothetical protein